MHDSEQIPLADEHRGAIPFIGRERELTILRQALDQVQRGQRRTVLLSGDAGIGKTRVAEILSAEALSRGFRVGWGSCHEWEGAPAFWPWIQVLRSIARADDLARIERELGSRFATLVHLVPDLVASHSFVVDPQPLSGDAARFRLFDSIVALLIAVARDTPMVVILDDLHWADTTSLLLLQFVAQHTRDLPLLLLGTYRSGEVSPKHPLADLVGELVRISGTERISLQGLSPDETRILIEAAVGRQLPDRTLNTVRHHVEGNPLFAGEVGRFLAAQGDLSSISSQKDLHFQVPDGIRDVLGRRLRRLSDECQEILAIASVVGREFSISIIVRVSDLPLERVLPLLDEAVESRLLDTSAVVGNYRFHHALVQEVLYAGLPPSRRMQLHRKVAQVLEKLHAEDLEQLLDELAHHYFHALPLGDPNRALEFLTRAAEQSLARFAWESAIYSYERALQVSDLTTGQNPIAKCELLLGLGEAQTIAERSNWGSPAARNTFVRAAELARAAGSAEQFARSALGFFGRNLMTNPGQEEQIDILEQALQRLGTEDSPLRARVFGRLAIDRNLIDLPRNPLARTDPSSRISQLSDESIAVARRLGDPSTLAFALLAKRVACATHDNLDERIALTHEAVMLTESAGDAETGWWATLLSFWDHAELGDLERELRAFERHVEVEKRAPTPFKEWGLNGKRGHYALREGDFQAAEDWAQRSLGDLPLVDSPWVHFHLRREQDRLREIAGDLEQLGSHHTTSWMCRNALEVLLAIELGRDDAHERFEMMSAREYCDVPHTERRLDVLILLAESCLRLEDERRAQTLYELLLPYHDRVAAILCQFTHYGALLVSSAFLPRSSLAGTRQTRILPRRWRSMSDSNCAPSSRIRDTSGRGCYSSAAIRPT